MCVWILRERNSESTENRRDCDFGCIMANLRRNPAPIIDPLPEIAHPIRTRTWEEAECDSSLEPNRLSKLVIARDIDADHHETANKRVLHTVFIGLSHQHTLKMVLHARSSQRDMLPQCILQEVHSCLQICEVHCANKHIKG